MDDAALVARARQGDAAAFGALVDRHRTAVYRAALAALGSHADAEDAAQDAFLAAWRRLTDFRGDASFKTWLLTIAWHHAINKRRSLARIWRRIVQPTDDASHDAQLARAAADGLTPEERAAHDRLGAAIREAIRALPRPLRDALLLAQSGDYTYAEIGAMLGAPLGTIKWRVSEARRLVKTRLREGGFGGVGAGLARR